MCQIELPGDEVAEGCGATLRLAPHRQSSKSWEASRVMKQVLARKPRPDELTQPSNRAATPQESKGQPLEVAERDEERRMEPRTSVVGDFIEGPSQWSRSGTQRGETTAGRGPLSAPFLVVCAQRKRRPTLMLQNDLNTSIYFSHF